MNIRREPVYHYPTVLLMVLFDPSPTNFAGIWLSGDGGMGKTTLAAEVCYRLHLYHNVNVMNVNLK